MKKQIVILITAVLALYSCDSNKALPIQTVSQLTDYSGKSDPLIPGMV
jgi:hypothetical protein